MTHRSQEDLPGPGRAGAEPVAIDMWDILGLVWSRRGLVIAVAVLTVAGAVAIVTTLTPRYLSQAKVLIENGESRFVEPSQEARDAFPSDEAAVLSQVEVLRSRDLAQKVAEKLDLAQYREFNSDPKDASFIHRTLVGLGLVRAERGPRTLNRVSEVYLDRLEVYRIGTSRVLAVEFSSVDPARAAEIVNTLLDEYIAVQRAAKQDTNQEAVAWLAKEIETLRGKVAEAEEAVERDRARTGIYAAGGDTSLSQQQLSEINTQLIQATAARNEAQARARLIRELLKKPDGIEEAADVLNSPLIQRLREQQAALSREGAELSATLLPGHPRMHQIAAENADLALRIRDEAVKIVRGLENEAEIAGARVASLRDSLAEVKEQAATLSLEEVKLKALEREATAQRETLESLLRRYREASARQDVQAQPADVRIISRGNVPSQPSFPPTAPILALASVAGVLLGLVAAFLAEIFARHNRAARAVGIDSAPSGQERHRGSAAAEQAGQPPSGLDQGWPAGGPAARIAPRLAGGSGGDQQQVGRRLAQMCRARGARRLALTWMDDVGAVADVALDLGEALARHDMRPIVIDADLASNTLADRLGLVDRTGLAELLAGRAAIGDVVIRDPASGVEMIPAGRGGPKPALFAPDRVGALLAVLARRYEPTLVLVGALGGAERIAALAAAQDMTLLLAASDRLSGADLKGAIASLRTAGVAQAAVLSRGAGGLTMYDAISVRGGVPDAA